MSTRDSVNHEGIDAALAGHSTEAKGKAGRVVFVELSYLVAWLPAPRPDGIFDRLPRVRGLCDGEGDMVQPANNAREQCSGGTGMASCDVQVRGSLRNGDEIFKLHFPVANLLAFRCTRPFWSVEILCMIFGVIPEIISRSCRCRIY